MIFYFLKRYSSIFLVIIWILNIFFMLKNDFNFSYLVVMLVFMLFSVLACSVEYLWLGKRKIKTKTKLVLYGMIVIMIVFFIKNLMPSHNDTYGIVLASSCFITINLIFIKAFNIEDE